MSIRPPSDLVLDVARAADPVTQAAATRRLSGGTDASAPQFATALSSTSLQDRAQLPVPSQTAHQTLTSRSHAKAMQSLEAFFLRTAFDSMLPASKHTSGFAGAGGGVWKSMLADTLANQVTASGGLKLVPTTKT